jgi:hypothetical protein
MAIALQSGVLLAPQLVVDAEVSDRRLESSILVVDIHLEAIQQPLNSPQSFRNSQNFGIDRTPLSF